jgi:polyferredoxin/tetratricopeptide (TPR) repeat protein
MNSGCTGQKEVKPRSISLPVLKNHVSPNDGIRASKTSRWRAGVLITLHLLMIAHIVQWWVMGTTVSPIEPSEAMHTIQQGAINAGFIFFTLAIVATLIFGRFVCGWGCHIVALQDLCAWLLKKIGLTPRPFRSRLLIYVPLIAALYMFVWPTVSRALTKPPDEPLIPQFTNHLITTEFWVTFPPIAVAIPFLFICGFLTVYFLGSKGFCTYGCPYGGFFVIADKFAVGKIRVTDACNQCGHCTATCTSNVLVHAEVREHGMVVDPGCMKCMDCVSVCPNDALYYGFGKTALAEPKKVARNYSLTWPEEIFGTAVFVFSFFAVWNVYQLVPMLMAIGISVITTYLALKSLKIYGAKDLSFYQYKLKSARKFKSAGWVFLVFASIWIGLNAHSGWVRYHERSGTIAFERLQIPDELALAQPDPGQWLSASDRANMADGRRHLRAARRIGLFTNIDALPKLAWVEYLSGDTETALSLLAASADRQTGRALALTLYYRGAILNRLGRFDEAMASLESALAERPDLVTAREEKGEALWQLGRKDDAISEWSRALGVNASLPLTNYYLAGALATTGKPDDAYEKKADRLTPNDPYFHWMLGLRLQNIGMNELAERQFGLAVQLDPAFILRRKPDSRRLPATRRSDPSEIK